MHKLIWWPIRFCYKLIFYYIIFYFGSIYFNFCPCDNKLNDWLKPQLELIKRSSYYQQIMSFISPQKAPASNTSLDQVIDAATSDPQKYRQYRLQQQKQQEKIMELIEPLREKSDKLDKLLDDLEQSNELRQKQLKEQLDKASPAKK